MPTESQRESQLETQQNSFTYQADGRQAPPPTQDQLAEYRTGDIKRFANESMTSLKEIGENDVYARVNGAIKDGVLEKVAKNIEKEGSGSVVRGKDGKVQELVFDNQNPYDAIKVDVKIVGDRITVNDKSKADLQTAELNYIDKFSKALSEHPARRLPDGTSLTPAEQKTVHSIESALLRGDLAALSKIAPSLLNDPKTRERVIQAVERDTETKLAMVKGPDGKVAIVIPGMDSSVLISADGSAKAYENTHYFGKPDFKQPHDGKSSKTPEVVLREKGEATVWTMRHLARVYSSEGPTASVDSPEKLADSYIRSRQSQIGY